MVFSSLTFLYLFLPITLALYYLARSLSVKNVVLIAASLFFYAWGEPLWISLLLISSITDYLHGRVIEAHRGQWQSRLALASSLVINLGLLGTFKYAGFFVGNLNALLGTAFAEPNFALPIGISFYTFQTLSYTIDVYRGEVPAQKSVAKLLLYVSMFPQLVAGPIVRYKDIAEEIESRNIHVANISYGINRFCIGLFKKVLIANTAGEIVEKFFVSGFSNLTTLGAWLGLLAFALQIYFDFSGYSDMAIGIGRMLGFTFKENFNYPYISKSISDFWRRWHISLGSFFRDYVYIPLGGNRRHRFRNLVVVWFLTGLWHGASWNFILWGLYFGFFIALERLFLEGWLKKCPAICQWFYTFFIVVFGWALFYFTDTEQLTQVVKVLFSIGDIAFTSGETYIHLMNNSLFFIAALFLSTPLLRRGLEKWIDITGGHLGHTFYNHYLSPVFNVLILVASTALLVGNSFNPFLYFRF